MRCLPLTSLSVLPHTTSNTHFTPTTRCAPRMPPSDVANGSQGSWRNRRSSAAVVRNLPIEASSVLSAHPAHDDLRPSEALTPSAGSGSSSYHHPTHLISAWTWYLAPSNPGSAIAVVGDCDGSISDTDLDELFSSGEGTGPSHTVILSSGRTHLILAIA